MEYLKKKVKLITYIDHKSDLGENAPPQKNLAFFLSVGGNFEFLGGIPLPLFPSLNTPAAHIVVRIDVFEEIAIDYNLTSHILICCDQK